MQLLTCLQRIPAIFLLIENYKTEGINHHPFGATILELVQNTPESFEKKMISDMIIDSQREEAHLHLFSTRGSRSSCSTNANKP
jgi:Ca2+-binding EF-hand superfamily protein